MLGSKSGGLHYRLLRYILQWSRFYSKGGMKFDLESYGITHYYIEQMFLSQVQFFLIDNLITCCIILVTPLEIASPGRRPPEMAGCPFVKGFSCNELSHMWMGTTSITVYAN